MTTTAARSDTLFIGIELSKKEWRLALSSRQKIRQRTLPAGDQEGLLTEIVRAKEKLNLPPDCPVRSCYEAGRDGFWIHRLLERLGVNNVVVDAASIEAPRRGRRAKTDRLDAEKLVRKLIAWCDGDRLVWHVAQVPAEGAEDQRRVHREIERLKKERTAHRARISSLLALHGVRAKLKSNQKLWPCLEQLRDWQGAALPEHLCQELERELVRLALVQEQIVALERTQETALRQPQTAAQKIAMQLLGLRGVGMVSAWMLAHEFFGWRQFQNRRQVGALAGLCGTPFASGEGESEQGISKAGNKRVRWLMVELAWSWIRFQPESVLTKWFWQRFGHGNRRMRRIGIVALARKLLVALWKYLDRGELPAGAIVKAV